MRKEEQKLWDRISANITLAKYPHIRLERIEAIINPGIPDLHCTARGRTSWVELKARATFPAREFSPVLTEDAGLSVDQRNWHLDYRRAGGRVATLISVGVSANVHAYFLMGGHNSDTVNSMSRALLEREAIIFAIGKAFWPPFADWLEGRLGP